MGASVGAGNVGFNVTGATVGFDVIGADTGGKVGEVGFPDSIVISAQFQNCVRAKRYKIYMEMRLVHHGSNTCVLQNKKLLTCSGHPVHLAPVGSKGYEHIDVSPPSL